MQSTSGPLETSELLKRDKCERVRAAMSSSIGRRTVRQRAWRTSSLRTFAAPSSATATKPATALPSAAQAGDRSAIIYTVIECCRRRGLDPFDYLRDVFTRLPSMTNWQVKDLTPEARA